MAGMAFPSGGRSGEWTPPPGAGRFQAGALLYRSRPGRCGRSGRPRPAERRPGAGGGSLLLVAGREAGSRGRAVRCGFDRRLREAAGRGLCLPAGDVARLTGARKRNTCWVRGASRCPVGC